MNSKVEKVVSITLANIWLILSLSGFIVIYVYNHVIKGADLGEIKPGWLLLNEFTFILGYLLNLIIGFWLFANAKKFGLFRWSWMLLGFVYSEYSLIILFFVLVLSDQKIELKLKKLFQYLLLFIVLGYVLNVLLRLIVYFDRSNPLITHASEYDALHLQILNLTLRIHKIFVNIFLVYMFVSKISLFDKFIRVIWVMSVLVFGPFPVILTLAYDFLNKKRISAG